MVRCAGLVLILLLLSTAGFGEILDARLLRTLGVRETIRQVAATADGERIYVLTEKGTINILDRDGRSQGGIAVGPDIIGLTPQGKDRLLLQSKDHRQLLQLILEPRVAIPVAGSPLHGDEKAPVTIVIFDDFECPYCSRTVALLDKLLNDYAGELRVVFKNFPLPMHKFSRQAALAGLAAHRQGKFWQLHDLLFAHYHDLTPEKIDQLAQQAGLDMAQYAKDMKDPALNKQLEDDIAAGKAVGVAGTPTLFINGRKIRKRTYAAIAQMIDDELAREK